MLKRIPFSYSTYHYQRQTGFVLLSVMLTAIVIGIIALYNARITQTEVQAQQIERTTQRMQQWLLAALAYRYENSDWPITLDWVHNAASNTTPTKTVLSYDLVGKYFMPAAIEDFSQLAKYPVAQSATDTSWTQNHEYVIQRDEINSDCYTSSLSNSDKYTSKCKLDSNGPFKIVAQVPTKQIAEQIAAKLPAAYTDEFQHDGIHGYNVHAYITTTGIGSQGGGLGPGTFVSGFLPMPYNGSTNQLILTSAYSEWKTYNYMGIPQTFKGGSGNFKKGTRTYVGSQDYGNAGAIPFIFYQDNPPFYQSSNNKYKYLSYIEIDIHKLAYSWDGSKYGYTTNCDNATNHGYPAPNVAVSTPGFGAPIVLEYPFSTYFVPAPRADPPSPAPSTKLGYPCTTTANSTCPDFYPYTSIYGLMTMSFGQKHGDNSHDRYEKFLIQAVGLSNQARGAYTNSDLKDYTVLHEFSASESEMSKNKNKSPTDGIFPNEAGGSDSDEHKNRDHIWSVPITADGQWNFYGTFDGSQGGQPYQSGIDGINFFFICNGNPV